jgi:hypothetical protein
MGALTVLTVSATTCAGHTAPSAGFWFAERTFTLPAEATARLGGPLRSAEIDDIEKTARVELARAFSGLTVDLTDRQDARWRVSVVNTVFAPGASPSAGGSLEFGAFGGQGSVGFATLATIAIRYAPDTASRQDLLDGIGRGIGRAAAHEFAHQILGKAMIDDRADSDSYEYFSADRASQYFGTLHWMSSGPLLREKLGGVVQQVDK